MGTVSSMFAKHIYFQGDNSAGNNNYNNAAYNRPGGDEDYPQYTYMGLKCESGTAVCKGTNDEDANGNPINWKQVPHALCTQLQERHPGVLTVPNCSQSRNIKGPGNFDIKSILIPATIGVGILAIVVVAFGLAGKKA